jgi:peptidoglycan/LPS O-acetylase OafA/YrhL
MAVLYHLSISACRNAKIYVYQCNESDGSSGCIVRFHILSCTYFIKPTYAFYLLPARAWEMMVGGDAYLYPFALQGKEKRIRLLEWLGLLLIIGSYFLLTKENLWLGYLAIFPVLGSFLILQAQRNDSFITTNMVSQKIRAWLCNPPIINVNQT